MPLKPKKENCFFPVIVGRFYFIIIIFSKAWFIRDGDRWEFYGSVRFCFYGSVLSRFPKRFINVISWIQNYAMECVAELAWTCKFLYTSSLASSSMLRRLLRIVKVAREQEAPFIVTLKWLFDRRTWQTLWGQQEVGTDSFITPPACIENRTAWSEVRFQTG